MANEMQKKQTGTNDANLTRDNQSGGHFFVDAAILPTYFNMTKNKLQTTVFNQQEVFKIWTNVGEKTKKPCEDGGGDKDAIAKIFKSIHVLEENFNKSDSIKFWETIIKLMNIGGRYVNELHLELYENANLQVALAVREIKIQLLTSIAELFPSLKGLKITGQGLMIYQLNQRLKFIEKANNSINRITNLEYLETEQDITRSHLFVLIHNFLKGGSETLKEVHISSYQIQHLIQEKTSLPNTTIVRISKFGTTVTGDKDFPRDFTTIFPNATKIFLPNATINWGYDFTNFINGMISTEIEVLGVDHSTAITLNTDKNNIETTSKIKVLQVDMSEASSTYFHVFSHLIDLQKVIVCNYDLMCPKIGIKKIVAAFKTQLQIQSKSCKIILLDSAGSQKEFNLI